MESIRLSCVLFFALLVVNLANSLSLFGVGKEYRYNYEALVIAGQARPASFASAYKIKGLLKVNAISSTTLSVGMDNLNIGVYNGPWSYFPIPDFQFFETPELSSLGERFQIVTENGKFKTLILNDLEPEWASNMKRGLATFLQMDLASISSFDKMQVLSIREMTTVGECTTKHEVLPHTTTPNRLTRVNKFRNHADCPDIPTRTKLATQNYYQCSDSNTRDTMNSTAYAAYELEVQEGQPLLKGITLYTSILYWPFTTANSYQFSWLNMTITLDSSIGFGSKTFPLPDNAENHEDLMYVFEQPDPTDAEDENPDLNSETLFFHHTGPDSEGDTPQKNVELCHNTISRVALSLEDSESYLTNTDRFQGDSPLSFIPIVSSLDYDQLTQCYKRYSEAASQSQLKQTEFNLFLDGLILSGTSQASLVLRDVMLSSSDVRILSKVATSFLHYIRNPTEALAKEMDLMYELFNKTNLSPTMKRIIEFSMASLIGRCCQKTLCPTSGLLDKYINYFETKLADSTTFEDRTAAILGLRNLAYGQSLNQVLSTATGHLVYEQTVRVQAIWALSSLCQQNSSKLFSTLLPVFYNRTELCEIRTTVFTLLMSCNPDRRILHDIAYFMWTEHCPQTYNIVRSFLTNAVNSKSPCNKIGSYAKTILNYLPPGYIDPIRTTIYSIDYFDSTHGFGHEYFTLVQKSGTSAAPVSVYAGIVNHIGGFAGSGFGLFLRMEGMDKAIADKLASLRKMNVEEVKKILAKVDVTRRPASPMYLELIVIWQDRVILYYAADEKTISSMPELLKKLGQVTELDLSWQQSTLLGSVFYQQPLEIGAPISISVGVLGYGSFSGNGSKTASANRAQLNIFGKSTIANHAPAIGTMHGITNHRTLRFVLPKSINIKWEDGFKILLELPSAKNPMLVMAHGTSIVSIQHDSASNVKYDQVTTLLTKSCPQCQTQAVVSAGVPLRKSRNLFDSDNMSPISGLKAEAKFFDCERDHSRAALLGQLSEFTSKKGKNAGTHKFFLSKWFLASQHMFDYLFWSPSAETCGLKLSLSQDESSTKLQTIESRFSTEFQVSESGKTFNSSITANTDFNYDPSSTTKIASTLDFEVREKANGRLEIHTKLELVDQAKSKAASVCLDVKTNLNQLARDVLSFEGENEPIVQEEVQIQIGIEPTKPGQANLCSSNLVRLKLNGHAGRSSEQKAEAAVGLGLYSACNAQKKSAAGLFVPQTAQCFAAALEQTSLRNGNATIYYKVSKSIPERWKAIGRTLSSFLYPFHTTSSTSSDHQHSSISNELAQDSNYDEGFVELDINMLKDGTTSLNVHYQTANGKQLSEKQHFHGIDIPDVLKPSPIPARFSPFFVFGLQSGFLGSCTVTSTSVSTLDSFPYKVNVSSCATLMSADCGPNAEYAILVNKMGLDRIGLEIQHGEDKIEFKGVSDTIIVNGKSKKIPNKVKVNGMTYEVLKNDDELYLISRLSGIHVRYTGHFATITLDSRYRGVHCGLCGVWDSSYANDLVIGPNTSCPMGTPQAFLESYMVGDVDKCVKKKCQL